MNFINQIQQPQQILTNDMIISDTCTSVACISDIKYDKNGVLQNFETFFRQKLDYELNNFQENMHNLLTEQQDHIQKIVRNSSMIKVDELEASEISADPAANMKNNSSFNSDCEADKDFSSNAKASLIIEMLALSCQLSILLNSPNFT